MKRFISILIILSLLGVVSAYVPTYKLCFDKDSRGIECMPFDGLLDETGIWNRILTDEQVEHLYNDGKGGCVRYGLCFDRNMRGYPCLEWW